MVFSFVLGLVNLPRNRYQENQLGEYQWFQGHGPLPISEIGKKRAR